MDDALRWRNWPAQRRPRVAAAVIATIFGVVLGVSMLDRWMALLGTLLLLGSVADWLFPTTYTLDADGVRADNLFRRARRPWARLGGWTRVPGGFQLRGRSRSPLLQRLRGLELRCPGREDDVERLLTRHLSAGDPA